ncbi:MAG TPA: pyridoxal-phosphate dependent enzyme [Candidatus Bathyarchaeia archaeon]|nr:pyridoxal-phosphate dependent enzyme [Candidatus Bathyarchaeia archaeon]
MLKKTASTLEIQGSIPLKLVEEARDRIRGTVLRTPIVRLNVDDAPADIFLKLENLQPTGSFKVRGASNAIALAGPEARERGVYTCSAGNMAQALAWQARQNKIPCTVIVPDNAPETKLAAIRRFGAKIIQVSFDDVWKVVVTHRYPPLDGSVFIHPFADIRMMAGNGTAGLEVLEDMPDVDSVVIPFGGGGLSVGIASAIRAKSPQTRIYAVEPETAAPLSASFRVGRATEIDRVPSFVDGIGGKSVLPEMWERARNLLLPLVVSLSEIAAAIKLLIERNRIVAEGAGAAGVAAAMTGKAGSGKIVCIVSGGNIDSTKLVKILGGGIP